MKNLLIFFLLLFTFVSYEKINSQELSPEDIFERVNNNVVVIFAYDFEGNLKSQGSGVVINEKGWIVTNYHVFAECESIEIKHNETIIKYSDIVGLDILNDILILKIDENTFSSIPIGNSNNLKVGQRVYAIGSPLGFENSMSEGIISGLRNSNVENRNFIQITTSISPGSSGGAVVNSNGELIGISTLTYEGGQNINFAIPINEIEMINIGSYNDRVNLDANKFFYKGNSEYKKKKYISAINYFSKCIELNPNNDLAFFNRGLSFYNLNKYDSASSDFTRSILINSELEDAYFYRGLCSNEQKNYKRAIEDFTILIGLNEYYPDVYAYRGLSYVSLEKYKKAIKDFSSQININPNIALHYYSRGVCYGMIDNHKKAIKDFQIAMSLNPEFTEKCNELIKASLILMKK